MLPVLSADVSTYLETLVPSSSSAPTTNALLASLPRKDRALFLAACEPVDLAFIETLAEPGERIRHVYFPTDSFISLTTATTDHGNLEVGLVGTEGMLGATLLLGVDVAPLHAIVQGAGPALRMGVAPFRKALAQSPAMERHLKHYLYVVMRQVVQAAACNRFHVVEARLARWLLMTHDRAHTDTFHITHDFLAYMLGVRRVGVTKAATALQKRGFIQYHRGDISILDLPGLQAAACECYMIDKAVYAQIMH